MVEPIDPQHRFLGSRHGTLVHRLFEIGLIAKLLDGGLELLAGSSLLLLKASQINHWLQDLIRHEVDRDPSSLWTKVIVHAVHPLSQGTRLFAALLLLGHGIIKIGLVLALYRRRRWAYPLAIVIFALFVVSQLIRYASTRSVWLLSFTVIDLMVIALTWMEFRRTRSVTPWHAVTV